MLIETYMSTEMYMLIEMCDVNRDVDRDVLETCMLIDMYMLTEMYMLI